MAEKLRIVLRGRRPAAHEGGSITYCHPRTGSVTGHKGV